MPLLDAMKQILDTVMETTGDVETVDEEVGNLLKTILEKKAAMLEILVAAPVRRRGVDVQPQCSVHYSVRYGKCCPAERGCTNT